MTTKTITITEGAYMALKGLKAPSESFSKTVLRVARRRPLATFYGVLSKESGERFEKAILAGRKRHAEAHTLRMKSIVSELKR